MGGCAANMNKTFTTGLSPEGKQANRPDGRGKQANRVGARGNAPLLPTAPPPEGEVLAALCLEMLMGGDGSPRGVVPPHSGWEGGDVRHQRGRATGGGSFPPTGI